MINDAARKIVNQALDSLIWQAKKGAGSFLTFDMGKKIERRKKNGEIYFQGNIHLWIYLCDWVISSNGNELANSNSEEIKIRTAIENFMGKRLNSIQDTKPNELLIDFSGGLSIKLIGNETAYGKSDDFFILYTDMGNVSYSEETGFSVGA